MTIKSPSDFDQFITRVNNTLDNVLPAKTMPPTRLHAAMRYAVLAPGKRLRPLLVYASGQLFNVPIEQLDYPAASVEIIHAYSLIHDDLPMMDDDELRRGKPTCHIAFDEATAVLAGDALQSLAFALLAKSSSGKTQLSIEKRLQLIRLLGVATGSQGMAGGQMMDISCANSCITEADLKQMQQMKTGALIKTSMLFGAICAEKDFNAENVDSDVMAILARFGDMIGLGFQIQDDILDIEAETAVLGKSSGSDARLDKVTYPRLVGLDVAKQQANALLQESLSLLKSLPFDTSSLACLAKNMIQRQS